MTRKLIALALLALGSGAPARSPQDPVPTPAGILASLDWLQGSWSGKVGENEFETCYTSPAGGEIVSASKELAGGRCVFIELERFFVSDGELVLHPHPGGKPSPARFPLEDWDPEARLVRFANPEHDFPKSLTYQRVAEDRLTITIQGDEGGKPRSAVYDLRRK